jgi:hypothetical protein
MEYEICYNKASTRGFIMQIGDAAIMTKSINGLKVGEIVEIGFVSETHYFVMNRRIGLTVPHSAVKKG